MDLTSSDTTSDDDEDTLRRGGQEEEEESQQSHQEEEEEDAEVATAARELLLKRLPPPRYNFCKVGQFGRHVVEFPKFNMTVRNPKKSVGQKHAFLFRYRSGNCSNY